MATELLPLLMKKTYTYFPIEKGFIFLFFLFFFFFFFFLFEKSKKVERENIICCNHIRFLLKVFNRISLVITRYSALSSFLKGKRHKTCYQTATQKIVAYNFRVYLEILHNG